MSFSSGYGYGYGSGSGYGDGDGSGDGSGSGYGYGYGSGIIKSFCGRPVHIVDALPTLIESVHGNIARGYLLKKDFSLQPCFICKSESLFAHGTTLHEAMEALRSKLLDGLPVERRIELFCLEHEAGISYPNSDFFEWHHRLTGSCLMGRKAFAEQHNIDLEGEMTVEEFIALTENSYGGEIIRRLKEKFK